MYKSFEYQQTAENQGENGDRYFELFTSESEKKPDYIRSHWSVYGRMQDGTAEIIGDYNDEEHARKLTSFFNNLLKNAERLQ